MQVSTKLLNQQQVRHFSKINEKIADTQERVSTGKSILRASDDPVAAVNLSVAKEQSLILEQFQRNIDAAETKLNLTDTTLQQAVNVLTRFSELITMARNGAQRRGALSNFNRDETAKRSAAGLGEYY